MNQLENRKLRLLVEGDVAADCGDVMSGSERRQ